jgi:hypothetical protein
MNHPVFAKGILTSRMDLELMVQRDPSIPGVLRRSLRLQECLARQHGPETRVRREGEVWVDKWWNYSLRL